MGKKIFLTWLGKIKVIKSLCLSKIIFSILSIEIPEWFLIELKKKFNNFIWDGKNPRIKNAVLCNDYNAVGLKTVNVENYFKAQKISWIKRFLINERTTATQILQSFCQMNLIDFLKCNVDKIHSTEHLPEFYKDILNAWLSFKKEPKSTTDIQNQVIWKN